MLERIVKAIEAQKPKSGSGAKSWWRWPLLIVLVLAGVAVAAWIANKNAHELARLRHDQFKNKLLKKNALTASQVADNDSERDRALAKYEKQNDKLLELRLQLRVAEKRNETDRANIRRITWASLPRGN